MGLQEPYLAREQIKLGHEIMVVTSPTSVPRSVDIRQDRWIGEGFSVEEGVPVHRLPVLYEAPTKEGFVWVKGLRSVIAAFKPEIVHVHGHSPIMLSAVQAAAYKRKFGYTLVMDSHMSHINVYRPEQSVTKKVLKRLTYTAFRLAFSRYIAQRVEALATDNEEKLEFIPNLFGHLFDLPSVIYLGVDLDKYHFKQEAKERIRARFGWQPDDLVIGHAGVARPIKQIDLLLEAVHRLRQESPRPKILLVGGFEDGYRPVIEANIDRLGLRNHVGIQGFVPGGELSDYLSAMDIGTWPGAMTITTLQAMAVGLPIVTCRTPYSEALIEKRGTGIIFERCHVDGMFDALSGLVADDQLRKEIGQRAQSVASQNLSWGNIARQFDAFYRNAVSHAHDRIDPGGVKE